MGEKELLPTTENNVDVAQCWTNIMLWSNGSDPSKPVLLSQHVEVAMLFFDMAFRLLILFDCEFGSAWEGVEQLRDRLEAAL